VPHATVANATLTNALCTEEQNTRNLKKVNIYKMDHHIHWGLDRRASFGECCCYWFLLTPEIFIELKKELQKQNEHRPISFALSHNKCHP
jgi:hypothetical protein